MSDINPSVASWSAIESGNAPLGTAIAGSGIDDNLRSIQAGVKKAVSALGADIVVSPTIDLSLATGNSVTVTGSGVSVSSLGLVSAGAQFTLVFQSPNTLVNSADLVLPGGTNISVSAGDVFRFLSRGSGSWLCIGATPNVAPGGLPIGSPLPWLASAAPTGFLLCYGQVLNRSVYAALFGVLGTTFNSGGEAGTDFRIPDMRGRFFAGMDNIGGSAAGRIQAYATATSVGAVGGNEYPQQHDHDASAANALGVHNHSFSGSVSGTTGAVDTNHYHGYSGQTSGQTSDHSHGYSNVQGLGPVGLTGGFNLEGAQTGTTSNDHAHNFSGNTNWQSETVGNHIHSHTFSAAVSGGNADADLTHSHTVTVGTRGTGTSGNLPPVMFGNWIIRAY